LFLVQDFVFSLDRYHGFWDIDLNLCPALGALWSGSMLS
jgi:hypothetical protein